MGAHLSADTSPVQCSHDRGRIICYIKDRVISFRFSKVIKPTGYKLKLRTNNKYTNEFGISLTNFIVRYWLMVSNWVSICQRICQLFLQSVLFRFLGTNHIKKLRRIAIPCWRISASNLYKIYPRNQISRRRSFLIEEIGTRNKRRANSSASI